MFQQLYLAGYRRLRKVRPLGGASEAPFLEDHQKQTQLFDHDGDGDAKHASPQSSIGIIPKGLTRATLRQMNGTLNSERLLDRQSRPHVGEPLGPGREVSARNRGTVLASLLAVSSAILAIDKCTTKTNSIQK